MLCGQLDLHPKGDEIQDYLKEITGRLPHPLWPACIWPVIQQYWNIHCAVAPLSRQVGAFQYA